MARLVEQYPERTPGGGEIRKEKIRAYVDGSECEHDYHLAVVPFTSGSGFHLVEQCACCWRQNGSFLPFSNFTRREIEDAPARKQWDAWAMTMALSGIAWRLLTGSEPPSTVALHQERNAEYWTSEEWRSLRRRVLARAGGVCEGCLDAPATQVHHVNRPKERPDMAWDLRAVCKSCHEIAEGLR